VSSTAAPAGGTGATTIERWVRGRAERVRPSRTIEPVAQFGAAALLIVSASALVVDGRFSPALIVALIPLLLGVANRTRLVYTALLMPVLAATLIFGRAFSSIPVEQVYVLDAALVAAVLLTLPAVFESAARRTGVTSILLLLMGIALADVVWAGATRTVLRQSVLVLYAAWALVGMAVARAGLVDRFSRFVFWASFGATIMGALQVSGLPHVLAISVAQSLYIGYGLLLFVFAPTLMRRTPWASVLAVVQIVVIALEQVRSVWAAFPLAILSTLLVCGAGPQVRAQVAKLAVLFVAVLAAVATVYPPTIAAIGDEAASIVTYDSGTTTSDNNAKWRLTNWRYATTEIKKRPVTGIQLGGPEVPPSVCTTGCNQADANGDLTVLAGADLHNSILAIPLRFGLPAFLLFVLFEVLVVNQARKTVRVSNVARWLLACHLLTLFTAMTAVVLEGPYMGIFFWFFGGLVLGFAPDARPHDAAEPQRATPSAELRIASEVA
jgi:hypothetical protein